MCLVVVVVMDGFLWCLVCNLVGFVLANSMWFQCYLSYIAWFVGEMEGYGKMCLWV